MDNRIIDLAKSCLQSAFTVKKYNTEILDEDLYKVLFIRNMIEDCSNYIGKNSDIDVALISNDLQEYSRKLFVEFCIKNIPKEELSDENFNIQSRKDEMSDYFNYMYKHLEYPM